MNQVDEMRRSQRISEGQLSAVRAEIATTIAAIKNGEIETHTFPSTYTSYHRHLVHSEAAKARLSHITSESDGASGSVRTVSVTNTVSDEEFAHSVSV